ncbi:MAG TPA: hypothetical protein V6C97_03370 [Oculatellaceae cyanobacterium]
MSYPRYTLRVDGGEVLEYQIYVFPAEVAIEDEKCPKCNGAVETDATIIQHGFWEDTYVRFVCCTACGKRSALKQDLPFYWDVTEEKQHA